MHGGCVCIPSEEARLNNVVTAINEMHVNHAIFTPTLIGFIEPSTVPTLERLVLAGEAMSPAHVAVWSKINLVNGYGPTESSVAAVINSKVTRDSDCKDIGFPVGVRCWVVDPHNHDRLVPVGCTGELLLEGPTLARCYLNNQQKTTESFIYDPEWTIYDTDDSKGRRFYKTGDLVRYNSDAGSLDYVGRKDTQIKFHGQRVELGEIEHHLSVDTNIRHSLVLLPKSGYCKQKLVAVLSLSDKLLDESATSLTPLKLLEQPTKDRYIAEIRGRISTRLPTYMVPSTWICVEALPFLTSGKLDRKTVTKWVEDMKEDLYLQILKETGSSDDDDAVKPATEIESHLLSIWSRVLNVPSSRISLNHSFLSLGGDSISAMTCMNQCKQKGIGLTVQEVLRSKSIKELATRAKVIDRPIDICEETIEQPFDLSPIQQLHFYARDEKQGHFNQGFFLRLKLKIDENDLRRAIEILILRHSMLRARFSQTGNDGKWQQRITRETATSFRLQTHRVNTQDQVKSAIADSQTSLNAVVGPLLAIDLFDIDGQDQLVSMTGHHLVIDLVSWRIILEELEELLLNPHTAKLPEPTLPFQTWCRLQAVHCQNLVSEKFLPADDIPAGDFAYWGMEDRPNTYGDVACEGFELDSVTTSLLLTECHKALRTETVDILLSALLHSFGQVFSDRLVPAVYNEGHGREAWDSSIDISRTVGWFTVLYPVFVAVKPSDDIVETLIRVKDLRRRVPDNGRTYFASRTYTSRGMERFRHHYPMEVTFNYLGRYQQLERDDSLFQPVKDVAGETRQGGGAADVGQGTPRFSLFEISAVVVQNKLRFSFSFNQFMKHQDRIREWISQYRLTMVSLSGKLFSMTPRSTLSDFPLLSLTYRSLQAMIAEKLPLMGINSVDEIEDAYPCSRMQQGILLSRTRDGSFYAVRGIYEVKGNAYGEVDIDKLAHAWQQVVDRHAMLRTIFVENLTDQDLYCQIVLKKFAAPPIYFKCMDDDDVLRTLDEQQPIEYDNNRPAHRFTLCQTSSGKVFCKLEMCHVIMDGMSISILFRDLQLAYAGTLPENRGPLFSEFISYLQNEPQKAGVEYWSSYLSNMEPCHFPVLNDGNPGAKRLHTLRLDFKELYRLQSLCDKSGLTLSNAFHAAWSLTLRCYTGSDEVCFGYLSSGRDAPVDGVEAVVGPVINMLTCRVNISSSTPLTQVLDQIQKDYMNGLPYKHVSLAEVQHALRLSEMTLFNTCVSYRKLPSCQTGDEPLITFSEYVPIHDPTEYPISINIEATEKDAVIDLDYWTDTISDGQAANIGSTFLRSLENIIYHSTEAVGRLNNLSERHKEQIIMWNSNIPAVTESCVHQLFQEHAKAHPDSPAICAWDAKFSYAQLDELSSRLAHYLVGLGVVPEMLVPLCFDKSAWTILSMLAVLKAGGGCVPLDATHPKAALVTRVLDVDAKIVLASPTRAYLFEEIAPYVVPVSEALLNQLPMADGPACETVRPSNTAFIIFTSGSTGKPKGVILEHRAIATSAEAHGSALGVGPDTRFLQFAAYTFDNSLEEIFTTLMRGGCVCVPSDHDRLNNLVKAINELGVNFMDLTPTVAAFIRPSDVPNVRCIAMGGEPLTKEVKDIWGKAVPLHNLYGPSECSINCTHNPSAGGPGELANIGRSVGSVSWVVDPSDHNFLVPIGSVGELLVEGPILARGYLNDRGKTQESFIENPMWVSSLQSVQNSDKNASGSPDTRAKRRMYKTGDLVRYNSDGSLTYLGRKDTQVKLNGQRIELGEIEHQINKLLQSGDQSVVELIATRSGQKTTKELAAFVCLKPDGSVPAPSEDHCIMPMSESFQFTATALQESLSTCLPTYMVPSLYIPVTTMPLTSSGKLNRRILRKMALDISDQIITTYRLGGRSGRAPSTQGEKLLQHLWAFILGIDASTIGADDTFFRHGGDSVAAIRLVTAAREKGYVLTVARIFQTPKLSEMAQSLSRISETSLSEQSNGIPEPFSLLDENISIDDLKEEVASLCQVDVQAVEDIYPCTSIQEGLIALSNRQPGAYVTQNIYRLPPGIDVQRFCNAWKAAVESEVILRTRIVYTRSLGFLQVVVRQSIAWQSINSLEEISEIDCYLPSTNGGVLSRYTIAGGTTDSPHFVWTVHHALYDGWSIPILLSRVESYYHTPREPEQDVRSYYPRFIEFLSHIDVARSDDFWRERLADSASSQFPQLPWPSYKVRATSKLQHTARISRVPGTEITIPSIVRAAWALTVSTYSSSEDVVFGEILTGRDIPLSGIVNMVGPTLATVPTRIQINRELRIADFLTGIQKQIAETMQYQFAGLQHIKKLSSDAAVACDFQNLLAISHGTEQPSDSFWNMLSTGSAECSFYTYPLNVSCTLIDTRVDIDVHYDQTIVPTPLAKRLLSQFDTFLTRLCSKSESQEKIGQMELLSPQDLTTIQQWNAEPLRFVDRCIHDMIQDNAWLQPEAQAVYSWDATFTYNQLDQLSTSLAHCLARLGVGSSPDTFVPICFEKSASTIVGMLGILKAGAAFVPIDPQNPVSRLKEIVTDLDAELVLCSPRYETICRSILSRVLVVDVQMLKRLPVQLSPTPSCATNSAAYAIFTSGTSGKPKGTISM